MILGVWSDTHLGKRMYRTDENNINKFEVAGYKAEQEYVKTFVTRKPALVIHAGDVFDTHNPSVYAMIRYFWAQNTLAKYKIPTMTIDGNHDFNFHNKRVKCSAPELAPHTYFADYSIKTEEIQDVLFVMMPYIYDTAENIQKYLQQAADIAKANPNKKKVLVTHGITEHYHNESFVSDPLMLPDDLVELFNCVIIGHIHTPFEYKQGDTLVISPGGMIDYQAYTDRTGPVFIDTDNWTYERVLIKTPHIIKVECNEDNINSVLENVTEDIYHIHYTGSPDAMDNDLFIEARNKAINVVIDVSQVEQKVEEKKENKLVLNIYDWVRANHPEYSQIFDSKREELTQ